MTIKDQIAAKQAELNGLKAAVESNDADAIASAKSLMSDIEGLEDQARLADEKAAVLAAMKSDEPVETKSGKNDPVAELVSGVKSAGVRYDVHAKADGVITGVQIADVDRTVPATRTRESIADLFANYNISGNAYTYFVQASEAGGPAIVEENAQKPQLVAEYTAKTEALVKIAGFIKETDEIREDAAFLTSAIQNNLLYRLGIAEDRYVVNKVLAAGINGSVGAVDFADAVGLANAIFAGIQRVEAASAYKADAIIMNPTDFAVLATATDLNGQYYGGGFFTGAYGVNGIAPKATLWGLPLVVTSAIASGTVLIGSFKQAGKVIRHNGVDLAISNSDGDDFEYNRVTIRAEERVLAAVTNQSGFYMIKAEEN